MKEDVKKLWIDALTSGEYKQTTGLLKAPIENSIETGIGYCCLGVLCDLYQKHTGNGIWVEAFFKDEEDDKNDTQLTRAVREWAGLKDYDPFFYDEQNHKHKLSQLNDTGKSFEDISKEIQLYF